MWKPILIMVTLADRVKSYAFDASIYLAAVSDKVEKAEMELQLTTAFLKESELNQDDDEESLRILVLKILDVAQRLEDAIESYGLEVASGRRPRFINGVRRLSCFFREGFNLYRIGKEIDNSTIRLAELRGLFHSYSVISHKPIIHGASCSKEQLRRSYSHVLERDVVGLDKQVQDIVKLLRDESTGHSVILIWGMAGIGKTTLAKQAYHQYHARMKLNFRRTAWVYVSPHFRVRDIWDKILWQLVSLSEKERSENSKLSDGEIAKKLYGLLKDKWAAYLIVLDDLWSVEAWDLLKAAFPLEDSRFKLVITTRNEAIGFHVGKTCVMYQPFTLDRAKSLELFQKTANFEFTIEGNMQQLLDRMLKDCGGLPLAITMLAGLLARKRTLHEWEKVCENVSGYIAEYGGPFWVLQLSYDDLPCNLKALFLYFCHFPKDYEIPVKLLVKLWIAEGLILMGDIKKGLGDSLEDFGYTCLNELVERCVVHLGELGSTGTIKTCRIHSLMRELCLIKAEEENLMTLECKSVTSIPYHLILQQRPVEKPRRVTMYLSPNDDEVMLSKVERGDHNRSFFYFGSIKSQKVMSSMFRDFKRLRVLKVEGIFSEDGFGLILPKEIGDMVHLRFLSLRNCVIDSFPTFIGSLILLQTLDYRIISLNKIGPNIPNIIRNLEHLRHLYLPHFFQARHPLQLSTLHYLQTLDSLVGEYCALEDLLSLVNLRKLRIVVSSHPYNNLEELWGPANRVLSHIQTLCLDNKLGVENCEKVERILSFFTGLYKLRLVGPSLRSLAQLHECNNLLKLSLSNTSLDASQMAELEKLPKLRALKFEHQTFVMDSSTLHFSAGGFLQLVSLCCFKVGRITKWIVEQGAMPRLSRLRVEDCCDLEEFPDGMRYLINLKELIVSEEKCTRIEEGGNDFHKIQHVPSIRYILRQ